MPILKPSNTDGALFTGSAKQAAITVAGAGPVGPAGPTGPQERRPAGPTGATGASGDIYASTSSTSLAIGTGSKSLTIETGRAYSTGQSVVIANSSSNTMDGTVTSTIAQLEQW